MLLLIPQVIPAIDELDSTTKRLMTRIDTQDYVSLLEKKAQELGVDVVALQSDYKYKKHDM